MRSGRRYGMTRTVVPSHCGTVRGWVAALMRRALPPPSPPTANCACSTTPAGSAACRPELTLGTVYRVGLRQMTGSGTAVLQASLASGDAAFGSPFAQSSSQTIANAADEVLLGATFSTAVDMTVDDLTLASGSIPPPAPAGSHGLTLS